MKKTLRTSLGAKDAKAVGLDPAKCLRGATIDVNAEQAEALARKYKAVFVESDDIHAVAPRAAITAPAKSSEK